MSSIGLDPVESADFDDHVARNPGAPTADPWVTWGTLATPATGLAFGAANLANLAEETVTPIVRPIAQGIDERFGTSTAAWLDDQQRLTRAAIVRQQSISPTTFGQVGDIVNSSVQYATELVAGGAVGTLVGAPIGGAAVVTGAAESAAKYRKNIADGIDPDTAMLLASIDAVTAGAAATIPFMGKTLASSITRAAVIMPYMNAWQRGLTHQVLDDAGYHDMAAQYKMLDGRAVATDALMGGLFGGIGHALHGTPPAESYPTLADAALTDATARAREAAGPGIPADGYTRNANMAAIEKSIDDMLSGNPVDVSQQIDPERANFVADPHADAFKAQVADIAKEVVGPLPEPARQPIDYVPADNLSPEHRAIETRFGEALGDEAATRARYAAIPETEGGKVLNTDLMRELDSTYAADRTLSAPVHEPASSAVRRLFGTALGEAPKEGEEPRVMFTAGGTGAGKTTAINGIEALRQRKQSSQIVYDTNMSSFASADKKIQQTLAAGKEAHVLTVYREPVDALVNGALHRSLHRENEPGGGRTVPLTEHAATHNGAIPTTFALAEKYRDDPRVKFSVVDNSRGKGNQREADLEFLRDKAQNVSVDELRKAFDEHYAKEPFSAAVYRGFTGEEPPRSAVTGSDQAGPEESGPRGGEQSDNGARAGESEQSPVARAAPPGTEKGAAAQIDPLEREAQAALRDNPQMQVATADGVQSAREALAAADGEIKDASKAQDMLDAAINCDRQAG